MAIAGDYVLKSKADATTQRFPEYSLKLHQTQVICLSLKN